MKKRIIVTFLALAFHCYGQEQHISYKYGIEIFPQVIPFKIYSAQLAYGLSDYDYFIIGFTYLNNYYPNKEDAAGRFHAPTIPIGYRRYLWKNLKALTI